MNLKKDVQDCVCWYKKIVSEIKSIILKKLIWKKVFKNKTSKICGWQAFKKFEGAWPASANHTASNLLKAAFQTFYLARSHILLWDNT